MTAQFATFCTAHPNIQVLCDLETAGDCPACRAEIAEAKLSDKVSSIAALQDQRNTLRGQLRVASELIEALKSVIKGKT